MPPAKTKYSLNLVSLMPVDLVTIALVGFFVIVVTLIVGFVLLRIDNSRTVRENVRLQTAMARNSGSGSYQSGYPREQNEGELGWIGTVISEIVTKNPEIVEKFISNMGTKKE